MWTTFDTTAAARLKYVTKNRLKRINEESKELKKINKDEVTEEDISNAKNELE